MTLQDLADQIVTKFSRIHAGRGYVGPCELVTLVRKDGQAHRDHLGR